MLEVNVKSFTVYGINDITNNKNEQSIEKSKIANLWDNANTIVFANMLSNGNIYGVYYNYESDVNGDYTLLVGTDNILDIKKQDLSVIAIESGKYLKFEKNGELPLVCIELWQDIWSYFTENADYTRAYTTDFEKYTDTGVEIYIAIK